MAPIMPSTVENTCTHLPVDSQNEQKIGLCAGLTVRDVCQQDGCTWNVCTPPVATATAAAPVAPMCGTGSTAVSGFWDETSCNFECPPPPPPLFTADFCHPITVNSETTDVEWGACLGKDATTCPTGTCAFNNGYDLIPVGKHFCAPTDSTYDIQLIMRCTKADEATCVDGCRWRAGLEIAKNEQVSDGMPLFENNFCHPPTTDRWDELAPNCLSEDNV